MLTARSGHMTLTVGESTTSMSSAAWADDAGTRARPNVRDMAATAASPREISVFMTVHVSGYAVISPQPNQESRIDVGERAKPPSAHEGDER
ncbi:hypothetical protein GCM10027273_09530 [Nocardioides pakistanensis]